MMTSQILNFVYLPITKKLIAIEQNMIVFLNKKIMHYKLSVMICENIVF